MPALAASLGHQREHLAFPGREASQHLVPGVPGQQLRDDVGIHGGTAAGDGPHGLDEPPHIGDPVLEQVAEAASPRGQQFPGVERFDVLGQDEHRQAGHLSARLDRRLQALVGEARREPHVHHGHVGAVRDQRAQ